MGSLIKEVASGVWKCMPFLSPYIFGLGETLTNLTKSLEDLIATRNDVRSEVQRAEEQGMTPGDQVKCWLKRVEDTEKEVNKIISEIEGFSGGICSTCRRIYRCISYYKLGEEATKSLQDIKDLITRGEFPQVAVQVLDRITELEVEVNCLISKMGTLKAKSVDVKQKVQLAEQEGMVQTSEVSVWLEMVDTTDKIVKKIIEEKAHLTANASTHQSAFMVTKKATKTLEEINDLIVRGQFSEVAIPQPRPVPTRETVGLCKIPMADQNPVGIKFNLEKVLEALKDDNVGIIGLYGMGGVGKTTLLKKINNELPRSGDDAFDCAFWVVASSNATIQTLQQTMMSKLGMPYESRKTVDEVSMVIYNNLKNKKYILMLDDLWKKVDLFEKVGIPKPDNRNKSKIVFTTRSKGVCSQMAQLMIGVECLPWEEAWSLFQEKVGKRTMNAQIESYAKKVAEECKGLPLALIVVGGAMCGKEDPREWSHALEQLQNFPDKFPDLQEQVFKILQFSFDYLGDSTKQQCFLYCSLFPEDYIIETNELVDLWMGEGYLSKHHEIRSARDYGYSIIADLKRACLLESGQVMKWVKMHDVIRDMALRITNKKFLCLANTNLMSVERDDQNWNEVVEKMWSFNVEQTWLSNEEHILSCEFPNLSTILYETYGRNHFETVFKFSSELKVLKFEYVKNDEGDEQLLKVIANLENLEYLDLQTKFLKRLPKEMKSLKKLKYLLIPNLFYLVECPSEIISSLTQLMVFHMNVPCSEELLRVLENLPNIQEIEIHLDFTGKMNFLLESVKLQLCTRKLELRFDNRGVLILCPTKMRNLEKLVIWDSEIEALICANPTPLKVFNRLRQVEVFYVQCLVELDILAYAPSLIYLVVMNCNSIQRIVSIQEADHLFSSLKYLKLSALSSLEYICNMPLTFPALEKIHIEDCIKLEKNPFNDMNPTSCNNLTRIEVDERWWDSLEWRDALLRIHFSQFVYINRFWSLWGHYEWQVRSLLSR